MAKTALSSGPRGRRLEPPHRPTDDIHAFAENRPQARRLGLRAVLPTQLARLAYASRPKALFSGATPSIGTRSTLAIVGQVFAKHREQRHRLNPRHLLLRQLGRVAQGADSKRQSARAWVRRPLLSYILSSSTAFRDAGQVLARRSHESLAEWLKAAAAPSEGPEGRESEHRRYHRAVRRIPSATSSGSTLRGVPRKRCQVAQGVVSNR